MIGAVEVKAGKYPARCRLQRIVNISPESLHAFIRDNTAVGSPLVTDGNAAYRRLEDRGHQTPRRSLSHGRGCRAALDEARRSEKRSEYRRRTPRRSALPPRRPSEEGNMRRYVHPPSLAPEDIVRGYLRHVPIGSKLTGARRRLSKLS
ncbi:hypothetical protein CO666_21535 [Rhizobium chutanense]|uniref:ISXO2-like transposase domain-containing protein n=1 Tax=Rhizobium chutanense TaxID=2035448 RepID=A0A2A6J7N4_9HYPH|nr:hypothetical protein CO666_21535 [Rhizobium chutanense]